MKERKEEMIKWEQQLEEELADLSQEIDNKLREREAAELKLRVINMVSKKLKTDIERTYQQRVMKLMDELDGLKAKRKDISVILKVVSQETQTISVK